MKNKDIYRNIGNIDPQFILDAAPKEKKPKAHLKSWVKWGARAACLALIFTTILFVLPKVIFDNGWNFPPHTNKPPIRNYERLFINANTNPEKISGSAAEFLVGNSSNIENFGGSDEPPEFKFFSMGLVVRAEVVKNYPDTYYMLSNVSYFKPAAYRLIEFRTIEVIQGENIPEYFLYLIPEWLFVDMSIYDSLLISMKQRGTENYVLRNGTQNIMESFETIVFSDYQGSPELGNIIAFSEGVFDESLWQNESWSGGYHFAKHYLDENDDILIVYRGCTIEYSINLLKQQMEEFKSYIKEGMYNPPQVKALDTENDDVLEALNYVEPFKNGVFSQHIINNTIVFRRFINGCQTEETIEINFDTSEVEYSDIKYTKDDLMQIDNISAYISLYADEYADQIPQPPHVGSNNKILCSFSMYGWYVKVDGKIYGVIKTVWIFREKGNGYTLFYLYDDRYEIFSYLSDVAKVISRDDLMELVGTRNVYQGIYNEPIEVPQ